MRMSPALVGLVASLVLATTACAGGTADSPVITEPEPISFTMQVAPWEEGGWDHVVYDDSGRYLCVLLRGDDLAGLRARYSPRSG
jgi:hypothetical protein